MAITIEGDRAVRRIGNMPVLECGNTTHFMEECPCYLAIIRRFKGNGNGKGSGKGIYINKHGEINNIEVGGKIKENAEPGMLM